METVTPDLLEAWDAFFATVAGSAATLLGLLFVALGLNPHVMADDGPTGLRIRSGQTFHSFLVLLIIGLVGLIPSTAGESFAITLGILGIQGLIRVVLDAFQVRADPDPDWGRRAVPRFISPLLAYLFMVWTAFGIWKQDGGALNWLVAVVFILMIGALVSCWELFKAVGDRHRERTAAPPS